MGQVLDIAELVRRNREEVLKIAAKHGVRNMRVFGSVARGEAGPASDVDFLVETGPATSSWFPGGLIVDLESLLGRRIDVVTDRGLNPLLREDILKEAIAL